MVFAELARRFGLGRRRVATGSGDGEIHDERGSDGVHALNVEPSDPAVEAHLATLRLKVPHLIGSLAATVDGLLIAHDLPATIEPTGIAALAAAQLSLSQTFVAATHSTHLQELVIDGGSGHIVIYAAGPTALLGVLTDAEAVLGRVHLEARPAALAIAAVLSTPPQE